MPHRRGSFRVFFCAVMVLLLLRLPEVLDAQPVEGAGDLVIIGGSFRSDNTAIFNAIHGSLLEDKPLCVFGTASINPESSGTSFRNSFNSRFGSGSAIYIDVTQDNNQASNPALANQVGQTCGGFFFTGGNQSRVSNALYRADGSNTLVLDAIWDVYLSGGGVSGSSAGAAIMSDPMITGGSSASALANGYTFTGGGGVSLGAGLGFFPGVQFDQHHLARGRLGRLVFATLGPGFERGYGVDENTALVIDNDTGWGTVIGEMGIFVVDVSGMETGPGNSRWGIRLHYLDFDDRIHMVTGEVIPSENKDFIETGNRPPSNVHSNDIWDDYEAWRVVTEVADRRETDIGSGRDPNYDVLFRIIPETQAWRGPRHTYRNTRRAYTVVDIEMGIFPRGETFPDPPVPSSWFIVY